MHLSAEECPHCGLSLELLDREYADFSYEVNRPHDGGGVLRVPERKKVEKWIRQAEKTYPQLYFNVATCSLSDGQSLQTYGFWLMNRGAFSGVPATAREDGCVLIVIDVNRKEACLFVGYLLDVGMNEREAFDVLTVGHPYLLESNYLQAIYEMLGSVKKYIKRLRRRALRVSK